MASLYEINQSMLDCVDMETGEFDEERLHALQMERDAKIDNIIKWKINLDAYEKALAERENVFAARRKATHNLIERLKTIYHTRIAYPELHVKQESKDTETTAQ